jgi:hypothetical protein
MVSDSVSIALGSSCVSVPAEFVLQPRRSVCRKRHRTYRAPEGIRIGGLDFEFRFDYGYDAIMRSVEDTISG